ncbi:MAG: helix-turn-helix domain-containing protein [Streptosporangiaceae bacterium]|nr:helix-turn-helix domain-containing protein [Streptosporangiaceae bacterium]
MKDHLNSAQSAGNGIDLVTFGQRLRHLRRARGLTLTDLSERVGRAPSALSLLENGRREPKLSLIEQLASALSVPVTELLSRQPPSRRAQLEIALAQAQQDPSYRRLGLPPLRIGARVPTDVLEHVVALATALRAEQSRPTATPEEARAANAALRAAMRERDNYFDAIEREAAAALAAAGYSGGALSQGMLVSVVGRHGFAVRYVQDLPRSVRSLTDLSNRRIYVKQEPVGADSPRAVVLQALGHFLLGHQVPRDFADFLRQRVEVNYFAAAVLMPERAAMPVLADAKQARDLAVEDLVDLFSVSYEMAAHRFTNLATHHLDLPCHFVKNDATGIIYKAYENDGVLFPTDLSGAIEGQRLCRQWAGRQVFAAADRFSPHYQYSDTPSGTYFCVAQVDPRADRGFAVSLGVPFEHSRWMRGREATARKRSACPDGQCCSRPPAVLAERWEGRAWPAARAHSHILSALPAGSFPGVDEADIYEFLDRHAAG